MKRKIVSLSILVSFMAMVFTGVKMYIQPFSKGTTTLHIIVGFLFIIGAIFHLTNNYLPLGKYLKTKSRFKLYISRTFIGLFLIVVVLWMATGVGLSPFNQVLQISKNLKGDTDVHYTQLFTHAKEEGTPLTVEVLHDQPLKTPTYAIWVEDQDGNYIQDLYVSQKLATEGFINFEGNTKRPEALPVWSHRKGRQTSNGYFLPEKSNPLPDGLTGATPQSNYVLNTKLNSPTKDSIRVYLEVNQSYDWNEFYHPDAFPQDTVYSGPGQVGQPALVYSTKLFSISEPGIEKMHLVGHAHHSGQDGQIYTDLDNISSALKIIKRILVEVN